MTKPIVFPADQQDRSMHDMVSQGIADLLARAESYATHDREELAATNQPKVAALETRQHFLTEKRVALVRQIDGLPIQPAGLGKAISNLLLAILFTVISFGLAEVTINPFNWGWAGHLICLGIATVAPFGTHEFLKRYPWQNVFRVFAAILLFSAFGTLIPLADIRANQFDRELNVRDVVVMGDGPEGPAKEQDTRRDAELLRWSMILAALGLEIASSLAWSNFCVARKAADFGLRSKLEKEALAIEKELLSVVTEKAKLHAEPARRYAVTMRGAEQGLSEGRTKHGRAARLGVVLLALVLASRALEAASDLDLLVAVDVSKSQAALTQNGTSEFEENSWAVSRLLAKLPSDSHVTVVAVTERSFTSPFVIFEARLPRDPGYYGGRLAASRRQVGAEWTRRTKDLAPSVVHTDLFGFFQYASGVLSRSDARRKVIVALSDMRNDVGLDLERPRRIDVAKSLRFIKEQGLFAPLNGVEIFVAGAGEHEGKRENVYTLALQRVWVEYFKHCGATLRMFSTTREMEGLLQAVSVEKPNTLATKGR